jgi:hypothetical protein
LEPSAGFARERSEAERFSRLLEGPDGVFFVFAFLFWKPFCLEAFLFGR